MKPIEKMTYEELLAETVFYGDYASEYINEIRKEILKREQKSE